MGIESSKLSDFAADGSPIANKPPRYRKQVKPPLICSRGGRSAKKSWSNNFVGIVIISLMSAEMKYKQKWQACISFGEQTFCTVPSCRYANPLWKALEVIYLFSKDLVEKPSKEKKLLLERQGARIARISVFETNQLSKNNLVGFCEIDVLELTQDTTSDHKVLNLLDPSNTAAIVGTISISCSIEDPIETVKSFARLILSIVDYDVDGLISFEDFSDLINAFGNQLAVDKKGEIFEAAEKYFNDHASLEDLAMLFAVQQERQPLINCCPVCGEILDVTDKLNSTIHLTLCFDEGTGSQAMTGGFIINKPAANCWMFRLNEWAQFSSDEVGLISGSSDSHTLVFDRKEKTLVQEEIAGKIVLSMKATYQSRFGLFLMERGVKEILQNMSEKHGRKMNSVDSAKDIPKFANFFKDQINMSDFKYPLEHFKTLNEFFIRELKPGVRSVACPEQNDVAVCVADCRLMAFQAVSKAKRFWIKGRKFSIKGLLGEELCSNSFIDGTLVIFRLAPQDYHRFHMPVTGRIVKFVDIPGYLYSVHPRAISSTYCNVFTENKRTVSIISTANFGKVAFVAIGATMVGSITFKKKEGDIVEKGDEFGYFSFGGSTVICVFEKDSIKIDEDLIDNSGRSLETLVSVGMKLGVSTRNEEDNLPDIEKCNIEP